MVEGQKIIARDGVDVFVFDLPTVGGIAPVDEIAKLANRDAGGVVVATRNRSTRLLEGEVELVLPELRVHQHVGVDLQHAIEIFGQRPKGCHYRSFRQWRPQPMRPSLPVTRRSVRRSSISSRPDARPNR